VVNMKISCSKRTVEGDGSSHVCSIAFVRLLSIPANAWSRQRDTSSFASIPAGSGVDGLNIEIVDNRHK
jgi:hypothetical protein